MALALLLPGPVQPKQRGPRSAGFTLIEVLVVLAFAAIVMGLGIPALQNFIVRSRTEGFARETSMLLQRCRLQAIQSNREVVAFLDGDEIACFVDADRDQTFNPDEAKPFRTADWVVGRAAPQSAHLSFTDPDGNTGAASIAGFGTPWGPGGLTGAAVFQPNGSVLERGAFRIADVRDNFLEIRVAPAATGRIEVRKWQEGTVEPTEDDEDPEQWIGSGDPTDPDYEAWKWN